MTRRPTRRAAAAASLLSAGLLVVPVVGASSPAAAAPKGKAKACATGPALTFSPPTYVDTTRAGGEPLVQTHPSGRLLYSSHAGTTHFYTPEAAAAGTAAFAQNYQGQTYIWTSDDNGATWQFVSRDGLTAGVGSGVPNSGFSDPEFAIDSEGNVYFSEINLANIAVSRSTDKGSNWTLQNLGGAILTDRQWMEADRPGELYFVANAFGGGTGVPPSPGTGHYIAKSTDGGATFTTNVANPGGLGDLRVDKRNGTVYEAHFAGGNLSVAAFRNARKGDLTKTDDVVVAEGVRLISSFAALDLDPKGNVYVTWDDFGSDERDPGIYYAYSTNGGKSFSAAHRVDDGKGTAIWPWIAVGDEGRVAIAWLQADEVLDGNDAQTPGDHGWRVYGAATTSGRGCAASKAPSFSRAIATPEPIHQGTICQSGTTCQATLTDRRIGDYISVEIDGTGRMYAAYADTRVDGAVSLPGFVRQAGGPALLAPKSKATVKALGVSAQTGQLPAVVDAATLPSGRSQLPATGLTGLLPALGGLALLGGLVALRRRRRATDTVSG